MGLLEILVALGLLMWPAYRGWSVLLYPQWPRSWPLESRVSRFSAEQTLMGDSARFVPQWFPMFLLGGLFGKLMDEIGRSPRLRVS